MFIILLLLIVMFGFKAVFKGIVKLSFFTIIGLFILVAVIGAALGIL